MGSERSRGDSIFPRGGWGSPSQFWSEWVGPKTMVDGLEGSEGSGRLHRDMKL
jgi:hypothetical protein